MKRKISWFFSRRQPWPYRVKISAGSILFMLGTAIIGMAAIDADVNLLMIVFGFCLAAILVNFFHGWRNLRGISVKRIPPDIAIAGQPFIIRYELRHRRRWTCARNIMIQDILPRRGPLPNPEVFVPVIRPGETLTLSFPTITPRRGRVNFSTIRVATKFPFGIFTKYVMHKAEDDLVIFPKVGRMQFDLVGTAQAHDAPDGMGRVGRMRGEEEYYGVREYRIGDNPRRIHWRRTARTGQLMVREMSKVQSRQVWCILSTEAKVSYAHVENRRVEWAISAAAALICDALEKGMQVGLICDGDPFVVFPPGGGRAHRPRLLRELALRSFSKDGQLAAHIERLSWPTRWHGPCLLFAAEKSDRLSQAADAIRKAIGPTTLMVAERYQLDDEAGSKLDASRADLQKFATPTYARRKSTPGKGRA